ncbi:MAG: hypothetical protein WDA59_09825 [Methanofastidiosum sp.]|nr:hypothetical protein [Methanocellales archaeon]
MIVFDELRHAEDIINNGYRNKKYVNYDNIILVKYWKYKGIDENKIKKLLKNIMAEYQDLFNRNILDYKVKRAIRIGMMYDLLTGVTVDITDEEIELINSLDKIELRKMMFIFLVVWKFKGMPKRFKISNVDLMKLSEVHVHNNTFWDYIYQLTQSKMLSMVEYNNKSYYRVHIDCGGNSLIQIGNFDNLIYNYLNLFESDKFIRCEECDILIKATSNRRKYCDRCSKEKELEKYSKYNIKRVK